jgi:DNA-binding NtrC family response regulator
MVMMSGYPLNDRGTSLLKEGVIAWMEKPISLRKLSQIINPIIKPSKPRWS